MTITEAIDFAKIGAAMGEQLQDRRDLPATGNDLIQLADRIDSNFSQVRTQFNRVEYQFINIENRFISIDGKFVEIDKRFNILESKIDKLPGRISRQIFAAVASFTGIIAAVVAVTIQAIS
jgi:predicted nuclease with TOPRIM domain